MRRPAPVLAAIAVTLSCGYPNPAGSHGDAGGDAGPAGPLHDFRFKQSANPALAHDLVGTVRGDQILVVGFMVDPTLLEPSVTLDAGATLACGGQPVIAGRALDFRAPVTCLLTAADQTQTSYTVTFEDRQLVAGSGFPATANPTAIAIADLDHDGVADVVEADGTGVYRYGGSDGFAQTSLLLTPGLSALAVGDFNGDGAVDLVVAMKNGASQPILRAVTNLGADRFRTQDLLMPRRVASLAIGDVDGDGVLDVGFTDGVIIGVVRNVAAAGADVALGSGATQAAASTGPITVAELTGDAIPDFGIVIQSSPQMLLVYPGQAGSGYTLGTEFNQLPLASGARVLAPGDFARTGHTGVAALTGAGVEVYANQGGLGSGLTYGSPDANALAAADLDADGFPDLLVGGGGSASSFSVLLSGVSGAPLVIINPLLPPGPAALLATGDLDGDGRPDFVYDDGNGGVGILYTRVRMF